MKNLILCSLQLLSSGSPLKLSNALKNIFNRRPPLQPKTLLLLLGNGNLSPRSQKQPNKSSLPLKISAAFSKSHHHLQETLPHNRNVPLLQLPSRCQSLIAPPTPLL